MKSVVGILLLLPLGCADGARQVIAVAAPPPGESATKPADIAAVPAPPTEEVLRAVAPPLFQQLDVRLRVLNVRVPQDGRAQAAALWDHLDENALDSATLWRLHCNGLRTGVGRTERWAAVQSVLNDIPGTIVYELQPLRVLPGMPVGLELDTQQRDQTVFYVERDGVVSGDIWPASRRVLRVAYTLDTQQVDRVFLTLVPEIRQTDGTALSYTEESGWVRGPRLHGRAFAPAGFALLLRSDEFVVIAPGPKADLFGLVGGAFLTDRVDEKPYDSYVFVRAEVQHVRQRH
jgi:hypothetical protein